MDKSNFPIFTAHPDLVYLDNAATTHKPQSVIEAISTFSSSEYGSVHRGLYPLSVQATGKYEAARAQIAKFIDAPSSNTVIFTKGATEALNAIATIVSRTWEAGDELILSISEHHSNLVPWQQAAAHNNLIIRFANLLPDGMVDLEHLASLISPRTRAVSITHCSNVLGAINPIPEIKKLIQKQGSEAILIVDASQSIAHLQVSVQQLECDFLVFSGHKMYGPSGIGVWWGREELLKNLPPYQTGGDMVSAVSLEKAEWNELPSKFEAGTPNIEGAIGLGAAITYLTRIGMHNVQEKTTTLTRYALEHINSLPITMVGKPEPESGILSFNVEGIHPHDLAESLGKQNICIRAGHHCASPLHQYLGLQASARMSFGVYNTQEDIDRTIQALKEVISDYANT